MKVNRGLNAMVRKTALAVQRSGPHLFGNPHSFQEGRIIGGKDALWALLYDGSETSREKILRLFQQINRRGIMARIKRKERQMPEMTKRQEAMAKAKGDLSRAQDKYLAATTAVLKEKAEEKARWLKNNGVTEFSGGFITTNLEHLAQIAFDLGQQVGR